jgi:hypothetical protein
MRRPARVLIGLTVLAVLAASAPPAAAQAAPFCQPGQPAEFVLGFATLKQRLGPIMGEPLECEHLNPENGDALQHTTTGLAYYRREINTPIFTNGAAHYAITGQGLILWRNDSVNPPQPTAAEASYLATTTVLRGRVDVLLDQVEAMHRQASQGLLDSIPVAEMGAILDELAAARQGFGGAQPSGRLAAYDNTMLRAIDAAMESAETLLRARLTDLPVARGALLSEAAARASESARLRQEAMVAYSFALPIVVG